MYGVVYGVQKIGVDKFVKDMVVDLKFFDVVVVLIWMGLLCIECMMCVWEEYLDLYKEFLFVVESLEFMGCVIYVIYDDLWCMVLLGQVFVGVEVVL